MCTPLVSIYLNLCLYEVFSMDSGVELEVMGVSVFWSLIWRLGVERIFSAMEMVYKN